MLLFNTNGVLEWLHRATMPHAAHLLNPWGKEMHFIEPNLKSFEQKFHSQFGEDGVIQKIASCLGLLSGTFFEFGIGPTVHCQFEAGMEGNFVLLEKLGWKGVFLDGNVYPAKFNVRQAFITPLNINTLYRKHALPEDLDFMSVDVDGQEFWIWMALQYRPKVMVVEYNGGLARNLSCTVQFDVNHVWDGTIYHGASLLALSKLAVAKAYTLVYANGVNGMFIRDDLVSNRNDFDFEHLYVDFAPNAPDPQQRMWVEV